MAKKVLPGSTEVEAEAPVEEARPGFLRTLARLFTNQREASVVLVAIVLLIYFQASSSAFLSIQNIQTIAQFAVATIIIACGEVMLLICGEIDLSVGHIFALAPFIMYFAYEAGLPLWVGIILGLVVGAIVGLANGLITVVFKVPSFITTLGTLFVLNGITLTTSGAFPVLTPSEGTLNEVMGHSIYWESLWALLLVVVMQVVLTRSRWGLHTIATGSNILGASEVGINVNRIKIVNFMLTSLFGGLAGILEAFRITSIDPTAGGTDIMFSAVAGAVIGGTALTGGSGTIVGAMLGILVLSILRDGFTLLGVNAVTFDIIIGAAILIAMILNVRLQLLRKAGRQ